jgi:hypothetical protein
MEKAKPTTPSGVNVKSAPVASVAPMEAPMATPPPPAITPSSTIPNPIDSNMATMAEGGSVGSSSKSGLANFFSGWNWLEIGLMTLGVAGVFYTINYYRFRVKSDKTENADIQRQLDEVKMNVQSAMKGKYQQI